ncbi:MAG: DUF6470 family protein [Tissierellia bacterium]|nr:DUF6470 family protein [Tissierellia bacterium]MDD4437023.1 DUF6470 family protein [Tissierellia bacterium]
MEPLLEIKTIPMSLEMKINKARYEIAAINATFEMTRNKGGLQMQMKPAKLKIDTVEARYSAGIKSAMRSVVDFAKSGVQAGYKATATYAREGNLMMDIDIMDNPIPEIAMKRFMSDVSFNLGFIPSAGPDISWDTGGISMSFTMDELDFDWNIERPQINFIPGSIEFIISEYPSVEINYIGTPIFVPPSANPNYKEIDTLV